MNRYAGMLAPIVIFLIALLFFIQSFHYSYKSAIGPGPGFFPVWLSGILMILSLFYFVESVKGKNASEEKWPSGQAFKNVLHILGSLIIFWALLSYLGYILTSAIFLYVLLHKHYKWYVGLSVSIGASIILFLLFKAGLGVRLPEFGF